jgi:acetyl-CoA carboxylase carboxyl transferase subunit beta
LLASKFFYLCFEQIEKDMSWFRRLKEGITTATKNKKEAPDGLWFKCKSCNQASLQNDLQENLYVCPKCGYHTRIGSREYFQIIFDSEPTILFKNLVPSDKLNFVDMKPYPARVKDAKDKTHLDEAISVGVGTVDNLPLVIACMDFAFIGGSMGSVVGERISLGIDYSIKNKMPFMIISKSGGARMMEAAFSLMQMAKTSAKLTLLAKNRLPYFSLMTDPTTGGVTASYSMLGDINMSEPKALIGFAGPRVIKETIKRDLPEGFQTAEYLLEHGFLDFIVDRKNLKERLSDMMKMFHNARVAS